MGHERRALVFASVGVVLLLLRMSASEQQRITAPRPLPSQSYAHPPEAPFDRSDYVIKINQMSSFYDKPGEFGYAIHGEVTGSSACPLFSPRLSRTVARPFIRIPSRKGTS